MSQLPPRRARPEDVIRRIPGSPVVRMGALLRVAIRAHEARGVALERAQRAALEALDRLSDEEERFQRAERLVGLGFVAYLATLRSSRLDGLEEDRLADLGADERTDGERAFDEADAAGVA